MNRILHYCLILILLSTTKAFSQTYCNSNSSNVTWEYITNVNYAGINNSSGGTSGNPANYTNGTPANVTIGIANNLSVTIQADANEYVYAFIDWNKNGILNDAGEVYTLASNVANNGPFTLSVTPPAGATVGSTRMRVLLQFANASPNPCISQTYGEAEDYTVIVGSNVSCTNATFPASINAFTSKDTLCKTGSTTLTLASGVLPNASNINYQWQSAPSNAGPWTNIGAQQATIPYVATINSTSYFRCLIYCGTNLVLTSNVSTSTFVSNPPTPVVQGATRCGPGTVNLSASNANASPISWYTTATSPLPIATGNNFTTPYLTNTTTYYTSSVGSSNIINSLVGTGTSTSYYYEAGPYSQLYYINTTQYLYTAAELQASGVLPGLIKSLSFKCTQLPAVNFPDYKVSIKTVPSTMTMMNTFQAANTFSSIATIASHMPVIGWNAYTFNTPLIWNGTDNIVVMVCHQSLNSWYSAGEHEYTSKPDRIFAYQDDVANTNGCTFSNPWPNTYDYTLPNIKLEVINSCESNRVPIVATITTAPKISTDAIVTTCIDIIRKVDITSLITNYDNYEWWFSVPNSLFLDANATIPYIGGNAQTIYVKNTVAGLQKLAVNGTNSINACASSDTFIINYLDDKPQLDLGPDITQCIDQGELLFLDAGNPGAMFLWDNNYLGQVRVINASGTYWVSVENNIGCISYDTVNVQLKDNPISALGDDTTVCIGTSLILNAGNGGINYYWNTGATSNNITVKMPGMYFVQIIGSNGCIKTDTINVIHNGHSPALTGIHIQNLASHTFKYSALNPQNVIGYKWDFGDGSAYSYQNSPTHTYTTNGNFLVTLWVSSTCGSVFDTMTTHIYTTGINEIDNKDIQIFPNPANDYIAFELESTYSLTGLKIINAIGQVMIEINDSNVRKIDLNKLAAGLYLIEFNTNKGIFNKKFELIKN